MTGRGIKGLDYYELTRHELRIMLISGFRYALGRQSYIVLEIIDLIRKYEEALTGNDMMLMISDIDQALSSRGAGMECDERSWETLRAFLKDAINKR